MLLSCLEGSVCVQCNSVASCVCHLCPKGTQIQSVAVIVTQRLLLFDCRAVSTV